MALRLVEIEPRAYEFCITPTGRELPEMTAHWAKLEQLLQAPLVRIPGPSFDDLVRRYRTLPNWRMRFCTRQIKIEPFQEYAAARAPAICYVGLRADEADARAGT
jgi:3'-phosphoadenosine 5'-phosphosulfate sulfotransferase (PAPS reductase)/FAD synthetase